MLKKLRHKHIEDVFGKEPNRRIMRERGIDKVIQRPQDLKDIVKHAGNRNRFKKK